MQVGGRRKETVVFFFFVFCFFESFLRNMKRKKGVTSCRSRVAESAGTPLSLTIPLEHCDGLVKLEEVGPESENLKQHYEQLEEHHSHHHHHERDQLLEGLVELEEVEPKCGS